MSISFSAEMCEQSVYQVVCECGAYAGQKASSFAAVQFACAVFNEKQSKSYADCMDGCSRYYVEEVKAEVQMSNSNAGMFFAMMGVAEENRWNGGSMEASEFKKKAEMVGAFGDEGSYASVKAAQMVEVAEDAMSKGVKVSWC